MVIFVFNIVVILMFNIVICKVSGGGGGVVCNVIFVSNPTFVELCLVHLGLCCG